MSRARVVHKFEVSVEGGLKTLNVPYGKVVASGRQDGVMQVWIEYQPGWPDEHRGYEWYGTGQRIDDRGAHVATVFDGSFVWHLYEFR